MTEAQSPRLIVIPEWDLPDRLRKSLRVAGMTAADMAEFLGVTRNTVNNWTGGKIRPGVASLRAWAMRTNVDYDWLTGGLNGIKVTDSSAVRHQGLEPRTRWLRVCDPVGEPGAALAPVIPLYPPRRRAS